MMSLRLIPKPYSPTDTVAAASIWRASSCAFSDVRSVSARAAAESSTVHSPSATAVNTSAIRVSCSSVSRRREREDSMNGPRVIRTGWRGKGGPETLRLKT